jgi:hypothetical protein
MYLRRRYTPETGPGRAAHSQVGIFLSDSSVGGSFCGSREVPGKALSPRHPNLNALYTALPRAGRRGKMPDTSDQLQGVQIRKRVSKGALVVIFSTIDLRIIPYRHQPAITAGF